MVAIEKHVHFADPGWQTYVCYYSDNAIVTGYKHHLYISTTYKQMHKIKISDCGRNIVKFITVNTEMPNTKK